MSRFGITRKRRLCQGKAADDQTANLARKQKRGAGMRCSGLRGDFARSHAAQRFCAWNRELHVPEVRFGRDELHSDMLLSIASPVESSISEWRSSRQIG